MPRVVVHGQGAVRLQLPPGLRGHRAGWQETAGAAAIGVVVARACKHMIFKRPIPLLSIDTVRV